MNYSMYETLMDLPLLKGISEDQVSALIEKTPLSFLNFKKDEIIEKVGNPVDGIKFILKGSVEISHYLENTNLIIKELLNKSSVIGAVYLFGQFRDYPFTVKAVTDCNIMEIRKNEFVKILKSDNIYLINFCNYLSFRAQYNLNIEKLLSSSDISSKLEILLAVTTSPDSDTVVLEGSPSDFTNYFNCSLDDFFSWASTEAIQGLVSFSTIPSSQRDAAKEELRLTVISKKGFFKSLIHR